MFFLSNLKLFLQTFTTQKYSNHGFALVGQINTKQFIFYFESPTSQPVIQGQPTVLNTPQSRKFYLDSYTVNVVIN